METISYSENWGGKFFPDNFSTVLEHDKEKHVPGKQLEFELNGRSWGIIEITAVRTFEYGHIRNVGAYIECGQNPAWLAEYLRKKYAPKGQMLQPDHLFDHIVQRWLHRDMTAQLPQLMAWWEERQQMTMQSFWAIQNKKNEGIL